MYHFYFTFERDRDVRCRALATHRPVDAIAVARHTAAAARSGA